MKGDDLEQQPSPENESWPIPPPFPNGEEVTRPTAPSEEVVEEQTEEIESEQEVEVVEPVVETRGVGYSSNDLAQNVAPVRTNAGEDDSPRTDYKEFERLFRLWKETGDPAIRERMIFMHRNLVTYLARRFVERGDLYEDVVQVGLLGLIYAIDAFDINRGLKFSTFAIPTISGEMRRFFRDKVSGLKVPRRLQELYLMIHPHVEAMTHRLGRAPTYAEIASDLNIEVEEVVEALELGSALDPASLDDFQFNDSEGSSIADSIGALDPNLAVYEEHTALQAALERLSEKERIVLEMAYFEGHSQAEIARRLNVSQMHISRLLRKALSQLRQLLEEV